MAGTRDEIEPAVGAGLGTLAETEDGIQDSVFGREVVFIELGTVYFSVGLGDNEVA